MKTYCTYELENVEWLFPDKLSYKTKLFDLFIVQCILYNFKVI